LILCDTKASADTDEAKAKRNETIELVKREGVAKLAAAQIQGMVGKRTRESNPAVVRTVQTMMERQSPEAIIAALGALRDRPDATELLSTITAPTLILVGEDDVITPPAESRKMLEAMPSVAHAQLDIVAGAGHASCVERPAAVTHAIADYLAARAARLQES
jgi:pimeloyl-ACP methyl ester carboxylesterase